MHEIDRNNLIAKSRVCDGSPVQIIPRLAVTTSLKLVKTRKTDPRRKREKLIRSKEREREREEKGKSKNET